MWRVLTENLNTYLYLIIEGKTHCAPTHSRSNYLVIYRYENHNALREINLIIISNNIRMHIEQL